MVKLEDVIKAYTDVFYIENTDVIPLICSVIVSNKMAGDPVWLMIVGGSSSGKTEIINAISTVEFVRELSMITTNTLLSGMKPTKGVETSFLKTLPKSSVIAIKEFTTILSGSSDDVIVIMAQLREVYDGKMSKMSGNGVNAEWKGKVTLIAGVTEKLYQMEGMFSGMGTRTLNYVMPEQDAVKTTIRGSEIADIIPVKREEIKNIFKEFIERVSKSAQDRKMTQEQSMKLIRVCNFASLARSPVERDFNGSVDLVLSREMPMRMSNMLHRLGSAIMAVHEVESLQDRDEKILHKIALDSIPKGRRMCLRVMGGYTWVYTNALAKELGYPRKRVIKWLEELTAIGVIDREQGAGSQGDKWTIKADFYDMMNVYDGVVKLDSALEDGDGYSDLETDNTF